MNAPNMGNSGGDMMFSRRSGPGGMGGGGGNRGNQGGFSGNDNYGQNFPPMNSGGGMNR